MTARAVALLEGFPQAVKVFLERLNEVLISELDDIFAVVVGRRAGPVVAPGDLAVARQRARTYGAYGTDSYPFGRGCPHRRVDRCQSRGLLP